MSSNREDEEELEEEEEGEEKEAKPVGYGPPYISVLRRTYWGGKINNTDCKR